MISLEALWTIEFEVVTGWTNGGAVVLETNRVFGGDSEYYYLGTFNASLSDSATKFTAEVRVKHYHGEARDAFGGNETDFTVKLEGEQVGEVIEGKMYKTGKPQNTLRIRMTRRADLP